MLPRPWPVHGAPVDDSNRPDHHLSDVAAADAHLDVAPAERVESVRARFGQLPFSTGHPLSSRTWATEAGCQQTGRAQRGRARFSRQWVAWTTYRGSPDARVEMRVAWLRAEVRAHGVSPERALSFHPHLFQHAGGGPIVDVAHGPNAVHPW